ncbi:MAG: hypothetical protein VW516_09570 [Rhodospirillaceae bacterium]
MLIATTMSPAQTAYCLARAAYDAAIAESGRRAPMPGPGASEAEVDAWLDASEAAHQELELDRLFAECRAAEDAMLAWSFAVARQTAGSDRAVLATIAEIEAAMDHPSHLSTRNKAIDIALRLAA